MNHAQDVGFGKIGRLLYQRLFFARGQIQKGVRFGGRFLYQQVAQVIDEIGDEFLNPGSRIEKLLDQFEHRFGFSGGDDFQEPDK